MSPLSNSVSICVFIFDVTNAIAHYSVWITLAIIAAIVVFQGRRGRPTASPG